MSIEQVDLKIAGGIHNTSPVDDMTAIVSRSSFNLVSALQRRDIPQTQTDLSVLKIRTPKTFNCCTCQWRTRHLVNLCKTRGILEIEAICLRHMAVYELMYMHI